MIVTFIGDGFSFKKRVKYLELHSTVLQDDKGKPLAWYSSASSCMRARHPDIDGEFLTIDHVLIGRNDGN